VHLERLLARSRRYLPAHCIYPDEREGKARIVIRLFGALVYTVHCTGWQIPGTEPTDALLEFPLE
jgi:hypothetical protein